MARPSIVEKARQNLKDPDSFERMVLATPEEILELAATQEIVEPVVRALDADHVVVCLSGLSVHANGSPIFGCKVYGPFTEEEVEIRSAEIQRIEGGAVLVRPMVDLEDTYRRLSGD